MGVPLISLPPALLPRDGRFGSGPSLVPLAHLQAVAESGLMGTSHRQPPIRQLVAEIRAGLVDLLGVPADYEVVLGNGGSTTFWAIATVGLVRHQAAHGVFGEFGAKFASETTRAPFLEPSLITQAEPGSLALPVPATSVDVYAWPHNETSTGVVAPVTPVAGADPDALTLIDATSIAGAAPVDWTGIDVYYFAPQKAFASDGGIWFAVMSPRAVARCEELAAANRWVPDALSLPLALANSRKDQTVNTPALATLILLQQQLRFLQELGGVAASAARCRKSSDLLYTWAESHSQATPFVTTPHWRSPVVATIDFVGVAAAEISRQLRANGIVDVDPYRKLGRNQLRIATFPATDPADISALIACIDYVVERL